ncbi:MAG TPA: hypothetical protein PLF88_00195 [Opitutaceae bacterium]|nr:hypothetical protein [Opitutaceae bacterium]HRJ45752.1 hypothetical protein [Opitutaceae bacterium]
MTSASPSAPTGLSLWLPRALVLLLSLHFFLNVIPFTAVEGDEQGIINGLQAWSRGTPDFDAASYSYAIQPGSYHLLWWLHRLTGATHLATFGAASALAAAVFLFQSSLLLARITGFRVSCMAVVLLSIQEFTAAAAYANTCALAAVPVMGGLLLTHRARTATTLCLAGFLLGLGGWMRVDSLLVAPVVLALRWLAVLPMQAIKETSITAATAMLTVLAAYVISETSLAATWATFLSRDNFTDWQPLWINGWLVLGYSASATTLFGLAWLGIRRQWVAPALMVAAGLIPLAIYGASFVSPKYLHSAAPFLLLPALFLIRELIAATGPWMRCRRGLAWMFIGLHATEAIVGVQTSSADFRRYDPAAPLVSLGTIPLLGKGLSLGLGEGEILPTVDGPRMRGAQAWAPVMWRREKSAIAEEIIRLEQMLHADDIDIIITSTYLGLRLIESWLRDHNYIAGPEHLFPDNKTSFTTVWRGPTRSITVVQLNHTDADAREFAVAGKLPGRQLFVNDRGGIGFRHLADNTETWQLLSPTDNRLLTLYLRKIQL